KEGNANSERVGRRNAREIVEPLESPRYTRLTQTVLMRIGINTFLFTSPFTTESVRLFPTFKKWGFQTVEIPIESPDHINPVKVKAAADRHQLAIGSVCACMGPGRDFRGSPAEQKTAMDYCKAVVDQAVLI